MENYAHTHAGTEAGALAWFAIGYAHYLDAQYPAAIAALQKAQPQIGELKDYVAFFIGNSYVLSNNPEESLAYLRDFGTRFPDSLYSHDATIANAKALLAINQPTRGDQAAGGASRARPAPRPNTTWARPMCRTAKADSGAEILRHVYYDYATNYLADQADADLKKDSGGSSSAAGDLREHLKRADALYKARRYPAAADEYQYVVDLAPPGQQSDGLIQLANSYMKDGNTRDAQRGAGSHSRRRQRSQRGEVVSAGRDRAQRQRRWLAEQHPGAHARQHAEVAVAGSRH